MDFKTTCINRRNSAFTLVELMVAIAVGMVVMAGVMSFLFFSSRSFIALGNYLDLDQRTQLALDKMSREIRQVHKLTSYASTNLTFEDADGPLSYTYNPTKQVLTRTKGGVTETLLTGCDSLQFSIY